MINLWYENGYSDSVVRGPVKVVNNTIRALEDADVKFSLNSERYEYNFFLGWSLQSYQLYSKLKNRNKFLVGPQIWPFSEEFSLLSDSDKMVIPSMWVIDLFHNKFSIPYNRMLKWPCPIYQPNIIHEPSIDCLVYYKNRSNEDLAKVIKLLEDNNLSYVQLTYGNYSQDDFKNALSKVKFCAIIDNTESQGIAIQEMMASNKPLFVWDQPLWDHQGEFYTVPATSVPYWSDKCGKKFTSSDNINSSFEEFIDKFDDYCPEEFVNEELSPQKSIQIILDHYLN